MQEDPMVKKRRFAELLRTLQGSQSQTEFSEKIGIHQSALSGYSRPSVKSRSPSKATDSLVVKYLQENHDPRWSLQELQTYLESSDSFKKFSAKLSRATIPEEKMTVETFVSHLSEEEMLDAVTYIVTHLKKNCFLIAA